MNENQFKQINNYFIFFLYISARINGLRVETGNNCSNKNRD